MGFESRSFASLLVMLLWHGKESGLTLLSLSIKFSISQMTKSKFA